MKKVSIAALLLVAGFVLWQIAGQEGEAPTPSEGGIQPIARSAPKPERPPVLKAVRTSPETAAGESPPVLNVDRVTIRGRVIDERRRPVAGATIAVSTSNGPQVSSQGVSETDGTFALAAFLRTERNITFIVRAALGRQAGMTGSSVGAQEATEVDVGVIVLRPAHALAILVKGQAGTPLGGAQVHVEEAGDDPFRSFM